MYYYWKVLHPWSKYSYIPSLCYVQRLFPLLLRSPGVLLMMIDFHRLITVMLQVAASLGGPLGLLGGVTFQLVTLIMTPSLKTAYVGYNIVWNQVFIENMYRSEMNSIPPHTVGILEPNRCVTRFFFILITTLTFTCHFLMFVSTDNIQHFSSSNNYFKAFYHDTTICVAYLITGILCWTCKIFGMTL